MDLGKTIARNNTTNARLPQLRRLPVPPLALTLQGYLASLEPVIEEYAAQEDLDPIQEMAKRIQWAKEFETGLGAESQARLQELDSKSPHNWLDDNFWLKKAYHEVRLPLLIHSNWWLAVQQDPTFNESSCVPLTASTSYTDGQIQRAAWLAYRFLSVKQKIERNEMFPRLEKTEHWARRPALSLFNRTRLPNLECDSFAAPPDPNDRHARSILVLFDGMCFILEVLNCHGEIHNASRIYTALRNIILNTYEDTSRPPCIPISILTSTDRDTWARNRNYIRTLSSKNDSNLNTISDSLFALSLDSESDLPILPSTADRYDGHLHSARSGKRGHNRWHDKGFTLFVRPDGEASMSGEHSPCDALVPSIVCDEILSVPSTVPLNIEEGLEWERLDWKSDPYLIAQCQEAAEAARALIDDSDASMLWFTDFGTSWISKEGLSHDAFIQQALQLTFYKDQNRFTATYETALTRSFIHGRTETIRSFTTQSRLFVLAMQNPSSTQAERLVLLKQAVEAHSRLTKKAILGKGIDRHLLGLRMMMTEDEADHCDLIKDPLFDKSQQWFLSTSGLSAGERFIGTGFGTPYPWGYGVAYMAAPHSLRFGIESKHSCPTTSTRRFKKLLEESLLEMRLVCMQATLATAHL